MKAFVLTMILVSSSLVMAAKMPVKGTGEVNDKSCECMTCLIKLGYCPGTRAQDDPAVADKSSAPKAKGAKGGKNSAQ